MSDSGSVALNEWESKKALLNCGLDFPKEKLAANLDEAQKAAGEIGWPVVLKACSRELSHKSEARAVAVGISGPEELAAEFEAMRGRLAREPEGWLVAAMVPGNRELVLGISQQPSFGPCVMVGLGGVFTEVLDDVVFRMAPVEQGEARAMLAELKSAKVLQAFRGQAPADLDALAAAIAGLSQLAMDRPEIVEVDINPLIITPEGAPLAVDALVVLEAGHDQ